MSGLAISLILASALMHALWNVFVKTGEDRLSAMALVMGAMAVGAPVLLLIAPAPDPASWPYIAASAALNNIYFFLLIEAYKRGDLSHAYPIVRGTAPLGVAAGALLFAGETLSVLEVIGVATISAGIASLVWTGRQGQVMVHGSVAFPLATGLMVASYTVCDGVGVRLSGSPLGYIGWLFIFAAMPITVYAIIVRRGFLASYLGRNWKRVSMAGTFSFGSYGCAIFALSLEAMAPIAALRETSVIFAAAIGAKVLGEPFGRRRIAAAGAVALGAFMIQLGAT